MMSLRRTFAIADRVLAQLKNDHRTIGLIMGVPVLLIVLLKYVFDGQEQVFNNIAPILLGIFPLVIMFLVSSIATLRERMSGTLDRLMTQPISKFDFVFGYAIAFSIIGLVQSLVVSALALGLLGVTVLGGAVMVFVTATAAAFLGTAMGLLVSAFARNEFQAVQLVMPFIMPQILLCGLFIPRNQMHGVLEKLSDFLPLTYSVEAMQHVAKSAAWSSDLQRDLLIIAGIGIVALFLSALTIRRHEK